MAARTKPPRGEVSSRAAQLGKSLIAAPITRLRTPSPQQALTISDTRAPSQTLLSSEVPILVGHLSASLLDTSTGSRIMFHARVGGSLELNSVRVLSGGMRGGFGSSKRGAAGAVVAWRERPGLTVPCQGSSRGPASRYGAQKYLLQMGRMMGRVRRCAIMRRGNKLEVGAGWGGLGEVVTL